MRIKATKPITNPRKLFLYEMSRRRKRVIPMATAISATRAAVQGKVVRNGRRPQGLAARSRKKMRLKMKTAVVNAPASPAPKRIEPRTKRIRLN